MTSGVAIGIGISPVFMPGKGGAIPPVTLKLDWSQAVNSQYIALFNEDF